MIAPNGRLSYEILVHPIESLFVTEVIYDNYSKVQFVARGVYTIYARPNHLNKLKRDYKLPIHEY